MIDGNALMLAQQLLRGCDRGTTRSLALEHARRAWRGGQRGRLLDLRSVGRPLVAELAARAGRAAEFESHRTALGEFFLGDGMTNDGFEGFVEFVALLMRGGYALANPMPGEALPRGIYLTDAGVALVASDGDHPLLCDFVARAKARSPGVPDEVFVHLDDARACLEAGLARPGVILTGLAYECAIDEVVSILVSRTLLDAKKAQSAKTSARIALVRAEIDNLVPKGEERFKALAAWDFAALLAHRRNDGSHPVPSFPFDDLPEIQEYLVSAARHLPWLWRVTT